MVNQKRESPQTIDNERRLAAGAGRAEFGGSLEADLQAMIQSDSGVELGRWDFQGATAIDSDSNHGDSSTIDDNTKSHRVCSDSVKFGRVRERSLLHRLSNEDGDDSMRLETSESQKDRNMREDFNLLDPFSCDMNVMLSSPDAKNKKAGSIQCYWREPPLASVKLTGCTLNLHQTDSLVRAYWH